MNIVLFGYSMIWIFMHLLLNIAGCHTKPRNMNHKERNDSKGCYKCFYQATWLINILLSIPILVLDTIILARMGDLYNDDGTVKLAEIEKFAGCSDEAFNDAHYKYANYDFDIRPYEPGHTIMMISVIFTPVACILWSMLYHSHANIAIM